MDFNELIKVRRSVRSYAKETITPDTIREIAEASALAPSWKNGQPSRVYAAVTPEKFEEVRACLPAFNQNSSVNAGALLVTTFVRGLSGFAGEDAVNECGNEWGAYDLGLQNAYMILKASDLGLDTLIMGIRDGDALRKVLDIPDNEEVMAVIALGKRTSESMLKARKPVEETTKIL